MTERLQARQDALLLGAVVLFAGLALALAGFLHPSKRTETAFTPYEHAASFAYTAEAPEDLVYDGSRPRPGEPVFRALSDSVTVVASYAFNTPAEAVVEGEASLVAVVRNESGWRREIPLGTPQPLSGGKAEVQATLRLADVQRLIDVLETNTGVHSRQYSLSFEERATVRGTLEGHPFEDSYAPSMTFTFDPRQLVLVWPQGNADPFRPSTQRMFERQRVVANSFRVFAWEVPVPFARVAGMALAGLGVAIVGTLILLASRRPKWSPDIPMATRHRERLVAVRELPVGPGTRVVDVFSFDDLARIADRFDTVILCAADGRTAWYAVAEGANLYRFQVAPSARLERSQRGRAA